MTGVRWEQGGEALELEEKVEKRQDQAAEGGDVQVAIYLAAQSKSERYNVPDGGVGIRY